MNSNEKQWVKSAVCVISSVHVNPTKSYKEWTESLRNEDEEFERAWQGFKQSIIKARTKF